MPYSNGNRFPCIVILDGGVGGSSEAHTLSAFLIFPHQYWFIHAIVLSDQWFNTCAIVSSGNFRISGRAKLVGPKQSSLFCYFVILQLLLFIML